MFAPSSAALTASSGIPFCEFSRNYKDLRGEECVRLLPVTPLPILTQTHRHADTFFPYIYDFRKGAADDAPAATPELFHTGVVVAVGYTSKLWDRSTFASEGGKGKGKVHKDSKGEGGPIGVKLELASIHVLGDDLESLEGDGAGTRSPTKRPRLACSPPLLLPSLCRP